MHKRSKVTGETTAPKIGERGKHRKITTYQSRNLGGCNSEETCDEAGKPEL